MKTCGKCGVEKEIEQFAWRNRQKGLRVVWCRSCYREYDRVRYTNSAYQADVKRRSTAAREQARMFVSDYKKAHPCVDCGNSDIRVLDFDHLRDKTWNIADLVNRGSSIAKLLEEISKCDVRCANCHRIITWIRSNQ